MNFEGEFLDSLLGPGRRRAGSPLYRCPRAARSARPGQAGPAFDADVPRIRHSSKWLLHSACTRSRTCRIPMVPEVVRPRCAPFGAIALNPTEDQDQQHDAQHPTDGQLASGSGYPVESRPPAGQQFPFCL